MRACNYKFNVGITTMGGSRARDAVSPYRQASIAPSLNVRDSNWHVNETFSGMYNAPYCEWTQCRRYIDGAASNYLPLPL